MSYRHGTKTKRCPVCMAKSKTPFCSTTCRKAFIQGITWEAQLAAEMDKVSWSYRYHLQFALQGS